tara:strand:+ start:1952 stop:2323 length:372 start_codon:yes stop_codon:yes gene_type:complete
VPQTENSTLHVLVAGIADDCFLLGCSSTDFIGHRNQIIVFSDNATLRALLLAKNPTYDQHTSSSKANGFRKTHKLIQTFWEKYKALGGMMNFVWHHVKVDNLTITIEKSHFASYPAIEDLVNY